jgi:hypothetical protein
MRLITDKDLPEFPGHGGKRANSGGARPGAGRPKGSASNPPPDDIKQRAHNAVLEMHEAKAKRESYLAHLAELEYKQKQRDLISIEECFHVIDAAATACREHLMSLPGRLASVYASESDAMRIESDMDEEIRKALTHVTDALAQFKSGS